MEVQLDLSLGLFSSAAVDAGSMLLLKSVAGHVPLDSLKTVLDVGCGVGTLGLSLAKRCPGARITMVDRDDLAVEFSRRNARVNRLENAGAQTRLMLEGPHEAPYDLILTNFPAKAGDPVLSDFLKRSGNLLTQSGTTAIVIVHTLAERCKELILDSGMLISHEDSSAQHAVFHFRSGDRKRVPDLDSYPADVGEGFSGSTSLLAPYIRNSADFRFKHTVYNLDTVWNIADFDTPSWRLQILGNLLDGEEFSGTLVFWSPGQGHLPVLVCRSKGSRPERVILTGRDRLELLISAHNIRKSCTPCPIDLKPLPDISELSSIAYPGGVGFLLTDIDPVPGSAWSAPLKDSAACLVKPGGKWALVGRSTDIAALTKNTRGWTPLSDRRNRGWRAVIFRKN